MEKKETKHIKKQAKSSGGKPKASKRPVEQSGNLEPPTKKQRLKVPKPTEPTFGFSAPTKMGTKRNLVGNIASRTAQKFRAQRYVEKAKKALKRIPKLEPGKLLQSSKQLTKRPIVIGVACALCLGALLAWLFWPSPSGTLTVRANQPAVVLIDGESHGEVPIEDLELPVGKHRIKVRHERTGDTRTYVRRIKPDRKSRVWVAWNTNTKESNSKKADNRRARQQKN